MVRSFTAHTPLLTTTSAFGLKRICWISSTVLSTLSPCRSDEHYILTVNEIISHLLFIPVEYPVTLPAVSVKSIQEQPMQVAVVGRLKEVQVSNITQVRCPLFCSDTISNS